MKEIDRFGLKLLSIYLGLGLFFIVIFYLLATFVFPPKKSACEQITEDQYLTIQSQKLTIDSLRMENYKLRNDGQ